MYKLNVSVNTTPWFGKKSSLHTGQFYYAYGCTWAIWLPVWGFGDTQVMIPVYQSSPTTFTLLTEVKATLYKGHHSELVNHMSPRVPVIGQTFV